LAAADTENYPEAADRFRQINNVDTDYLYGLGDNSVKRKLHGTLLG
jgi:hypothetical protein